MPHSSGGGSSGGGAHSHSSRGGSGRRSSILSRHRYSRKNYPGARYYSYYKGTEKIEFYAKEKPKKGGCFLSIMLCILSIIYSVAFILGLLDSIGFPEKLADTEQYFTGTYIEDGTDIIEDGVEEELESKLLAFQEKTGIIPYVITLHNDDLPATYGTISYDSLDQYSYDLYVNRFDDESHFLLVYSENEDGTDWYWAGMQGNDTDHILTEAHFRLFQEDAQKYLNENDYTVGAAFAKTFENSTGYMLKNNYDLIPLYVVMFFVFCAFLAVLLGFALRAVIAQKRINEYCDYESNHAAEYVTEEPEDVNRTHSYNLNGKRYDE